MNKKIILALAVVAILALGLYGFTGQTSQPEEEQSLIESMGQPIEKIGYVDSPESGSGTTSQVTPITLDAEDIVYIKIIMTWLDDVPESELDQFSLSVSGGIGATPVTGNQGELTLEITPSNDNFLPNSFDIVIELLSAGSTSGGIAGILPIFNQPDPGNDYQLRVEHSFMELVVQSSGSGMAPGFTVTGTDGNKISLSDYKGDVLILDMNMRCKTCEDQIEVLKHIRDHYPDVKILTVNIVPSDTMEDIKEFKQETGADWTFAKDTDDLRSKYQVVGMRKLVVIDPDGRMIYADENLVPTTELELEIEAAKSGSASSIGMGNLGIGMLAIFGGVTSFFAPCAFALLPGYVTHYMSKVEKERHNALRFGLVSGMIAGLGIFVVYMALGFLITIFGTAISSVMHWLTLFAGGIIVIMGIAMLADRPIQWQVYLYRIRKAIGLEGDEKKLNLGFSELAKREDSELFFYGAGYAAASTGCHGVIFLSIVLMAVTLGGFAKAIGVSIIYSVAMASSMVALTVGLSMAKDKSIDGLKKYTPMLSRLSSVLLIIAGLYIIYDNLLLH
jgi:cytochrome c-type biogenesis protein